MIIAIAGAPGSGKSTIADGLAAALNAASPGQAAVLPMDGYHYDDSVLKQMGRLPYKGAPDTFDVAGLAYMLQRLQQNTQSSVAVPVFDRDLEVARSAARLIPQTVSMVIVEGNYILSTADLWSHLHPYFHFTVMLDVPEGELRRRLTERWTHYGLDDAQMAHKLDGNDLPNGRFVRETSVKPDLVLHFDINQ